MSHIHIVNVLYYTTISILDAYKRVFNIIVIHYTCTTLNAFRLAENHLATQNIMQVLGCRIVNTCIVLLWR
jgi:hypothetical protein